MKKLINESLDNFIKSNKGKLSSKYSIKQKMIKESLDGFMKENETKEAPVKEPAIKPRIRPGKPSPFRKNRPGFKPRPKATLEDVINRIKELVD